METVTSIYLFFQFTKSKKVNWKRSLATQSPFQAITDRECLSAIQNNASGGKSSPEVMGELKQ